MRTLTIRWNGNHPTSWRGKRRTPPSPGGLTSWSGVRFTDSRPGGRGDASGDQTIFLWRCDRVFSPLFLLLQCFYFPHRRFYPVRPSDCMSSVEAWVYSAPQVKVLKIKSWASGKLRNSKKLYLFTLFLHCTLSLFSFKIRLKDSWYKTSVMWPVIFSLIKLILYTG